MHGTDMAAQPFTGRGAHRRDPSPYPSLSRKCEKREKFNSIKADWGNFLSLSPSRIAIGPSVCSMQAGQGLWGPQVHIENMGIIFTIWAHPYSAHTC